MLKSTCFALWLVPALMVWNTGVLSAANDEKPDTAAVVEGNNLLALDLYGKLRERPGNLFFSPYSISSALAMTYAGARGETASQMADALHFDDHLDKFHAAMGQLIHDLNAGGKEAGYTLSVANALWAQQGHTFLADYTTLVKSRYEAGLKELDFRSATEAARRTINAWVEKQTNDKIKDLLKPGVLTPDTRLVLTNAIYFKSGWETPFEKDATKAAPFTHDNGTRVKVPMMHGDHHFTYAHDGGVAAVDLPYAQGRLSMIVLLPDKPNGIAALEKKLAQPYLSGLLSKLERRKVDLALPKFKATSEFSLKDVLESLGMRLAFTPAADFSGMDGQKDLFIEHVVHKAFVDVNEEGTEAAAATGVAVTATAIRVEPELPVVFHADHPFLFLIRDNGSQSILFVGRVMDPK